MACVGMGLALLTACGPQTDSASLGTSPLGTPQSVSPPVYPPLTGAAQPSGQIGTANQGSVPGQFAASPATGVRGFAVAHLGNRLTSTQGRTLYVYDRDPPGQSVCVGECARIWPPYLVEPGAAAGGQTDIIQRADGQQQWAVGGRPLYLYAGDQAAHQAAGEGLEGGTWHSVPYPVPARYGAAQASIPPFPSSTVGLPLFHGSGTK